MHCLACKTPCLETDTHCPGCHRLLTDAPPERSAANFCGFLFAAFGAAALTFGPVPTWLDENPAIRAGMGGLIGGIIGAIVGLIIDQFDRKKSDSKSPDPMMPSPARMRFPPSTRF